VLTPKPAWRSCLIRQVLEKTSLPDSAELSLDIDPLSVL
jgi:hypothetical protein